jgi:hypothetical protein
MSDAYVAALLDELRSCEAQSLVERVTSIKAELSRLGYGVTNDDLPSEVETALLAPVETAARRPGRPRKDA